jgi:16S rRNA (guanine527-N7)-methyltransferase
VARLSVGQADMSDEALAALRQVNYSGPSAISEVAVDLDRLLALLVKWQRVQNLVSRETLDEFWSRHVVDSLQLLSLLPNKPLTIVDLGSGGGFPALPLAIALKEAPIEFKLVESNKRKCSFLRTVARELGLSVKVFDERIDSDVSRETGVADIVTARALASLSQLFSYAYRYWGPETLGLFHKGREHVEEIKESGAAWDFDVVISPSIVDQSGVVLAVRNLQPKDDH